MKGEAFQGAWKIATAMGIPVRLRFSWFIILFPRGRPGLPSFSYWLKGLLAAGLDVLAEESGIREEAELLRSIYQKKYDLETLLVSHLLLRLRNVIITPHSAFYTREAVRRILNTTVENIISFLQGKPRNIAVRGAP